jgi:hypothetical protein
LFPSIANRTPRRIDAAVERGLRNDPSLPDGSEQVALAVHPLAVTDQMGKKVEYLRLNGSQRPRAAQFAPVYVERKVFKNIEQFSDPGRLRSPV